VGLFKATISTSPDKLAVVITLKNLERLQLSIVLGTSETIATALVNTESDVF
jgi:hypothetical protein